MTELNKIPNAFPESVSEFIYPDFLLLTAHDLFLVFQKADLTPKSYLMAEYNYLYLASELTFLLPSYYPTFNSIFYYVCYTLSKSIAKEGTVQYTCLIIILIHSFMIIMMGIPNT